MRISDWSSDVCSSDLVVIDAFERGAIDAMRDGGDLLDRDIACIGQENPSDPPIPGIVAALDQAERLEPRHERADADLAAFQRPRKLGDRKSTRLNSSH